MASEKQRLWESGPSDEQQKPVQGYQPPYGTGWLSLPATRGWAACRSAAHSVALDVSQNKFIVRKWQILSWGAQERQRTERRISAIKRLQKAGEVPAGCRGALTGTAVGAPLQPGVLGWQCPERGLTGINEDYTKLENALGSGKFWKPVCFDQDCMQIRDEIRWTHVTSFCWSVSSGP